LVTSSFNAEISFLSAVLPGDAVVFDVGANKGDWSAAALGLDRGTRIHAFEPAPVPFRELLGRFADHAREGRILCNPIAASSSVGTVGFYYYDSAPTWGGLHRRSSVEAQLNLEAPVRLLVPTTTLDEYCAGLGIRHIHFLKIDVEGNELEVLRGAAGLLSRRSIDYLQFEYGGTFIDANARLKDAYDFLRSMNYSIFRLEQEEFRLIDAFSDDLEDYEFRIYFAVAPRHRDRLLKPGAGMFDYGDLFARHRIAPRGVIHIGANEGQEYEKYRKAGIEKVVFVEADPATFERLSGRFTGNPDVTCVQTAISDRSGTTSFTRMSEDQSNSILPPKLHLEVYSSIHVVDTVEIATETLDAMVRRLDLDASAYNVLAIDVQGAELHVLKGAQPLLRRFDAIVTEVNYAELYDGCGLIWDIDDFLEQNGFRRAEEVCPYHATWGDALYLRRPVFSMRTLGTNGRFANQMFQYFFLKYVAEKHDAIVETPPWTGEAFFDGPEGRRVSGDYPQIAQDPRNLDIDAMLRQVEGHREADIWGYFQYHTRSFAERRDLFRSIFRFRAPVLSVLDTAFSRLRGTDGTVVALHLRRGDYGNSYFFIPPNAWYVAALREILPKLHKPVVYIASDEIGTVIDDFSEFSPVTSADLMPNLIDQQFILDFFVLRMADAILASNSSFSVAAAMLNENARIFLRPDLTAGKMIAFDPWNTPVLLRDEPPADR